MNKKRTFASKRRVCGDAGCCTPGAAEYVSGSWRTVTRALSLGVG
jgi:hypothetical protein